MNQKSRREWRSLSEAETGATADASLEARWLVECLGGGEGLVRDRGQHNITLSYARPGQGGGRHTPVVPEEDAKREVGKNSEEVTTSKVRIPYFRVVIYNRISTISMHISLLSSPQQ